MSEIDAWQFIRGTLFLAAGYLVAAPFARSLARRRYPELRRSSFWVGYAIIYAAAAGLMSLIVLAADHRMFGFHW